MQKFLSVIDTTDKRRKISPNFFSNLTKSINQLSYWIFRVPDTIILHFVARSLAPSLPHAFFFHVCPT